MRNLRIIFTAILFLGPMASHADVIEVPGHGTWDVTTVTGSALELRTGPDGLLAQYWWGSSHIAALFANALHLAGGYLGVNNYFWGPGFAYAGHKETDWERCGRRCWEQVTTIYADVRTAGSITGYVYDKDINAGDRYTYAIATRVSVPEPGTLALFGIGLLGLGLARRRRTI